VYQKLRLERIGDEVHRGANQSPLDRTMQLSLTLAGGLRTTFADVVSSGRLTVLMRRLHADRCERSGEETMGQAQQKRRAY
jgi:hypothetical protein